MHFHYPNILRLHAVVGAFTFELKYLKYIPFLPIVHARPPFLKYILGVGANILNI